MLVTMADGVVETIADPEVVSDATITAYSSSAYDGKDTEVARDETRVSSVTSNGTKYDVAYEAYYDAAYLFDYHTDRQQMYEYTYNLLLDPYGYVIGLENVADSVNSFFVIAYDQGAANWGDTIDKAYVIFPDGQLKEVDAKEVNNLSITDSSDINAWYNYTINEDGVYEISGLTARQFRTSAETAIDSRNDTLKSSNRVDLNAYTAADYAYGDDNSVYIVVDKNTAGDQINKVNTVVTGLRNANITMKATDAVDTVVSTSVGTSGTVFGLFNSKGYVTYAIVIGTTGGNNDLVYLTSGIKQAQQRGSVTYYGYDAIIPGSDEITRVWTRNLTVDDASAQLAAHNLYQATYNSDGDIISMHKKDLTATTDFHTADYEDAGYAWLQIAAGNADQEFIESGRTLRFPAVADNNRYILLDPDCLFFVNGMDDTDGKYNLYGSVTSALTALGTDTNGDHWLSATATGYANFVAFTNANGQATTVIFYDREYEDSNVGGGGGGRYTGKTTITALSGNLTVAAGTYTGTVPAGSGDALIEIFVRSNATDEFIPYNEIETTCYFNGAGAFNVNGGTPIPAGLASGTAYRIRITVSTATTGDMVVYDAPFAY